ncbi:MAG: glycosyltransferase, partial [Parvularculaceae bacterium]
PLRLVQRLLLTICFLMFGIGALSIWQGGDAAESWAAPTLAISAMIVATGGLIVVDGGSQDATVSIAKAAGATVLACAPGRGGQLAAGAAMATAPWLLFLHADTRLDPAAWRALDSHLADPDRVKVAAAFRFRLDDRAWQARLLEFGVRLRVAVLALPYGDQGLLIHRDLYGAVGGYGALPLMEDV